MKKIRILSIILAIVLLMTSIRTDWWERADALTSQETSVIAEESVLSEAAMLDAPAVDADQSASESNEAEPESSADQAEATVDSTLTITEVAGEENTTNAENGQQEETGDTQNASQTAGGTAASSAGENADTSFTEGIIDSASSPEAAESATESEDPAENEEAVLTWQTLTVEAEIAALQDEWNNPTEPVTWMNHLWQWLFVRDADVETFADTKWKLFGRNKLAPVTLTISGYLPEGVTAEADYIQFAEPDIYSEAALLDFDLTLYDAQGNIYIPETDQPFSIQVDGHIVNEAVKDGKALLVYAQTEDTRKEEELPRDEFTASILVYRSAVDEEAFRNYEIYQPEDNVLFSEVRYTDIEQQKSDTPVRFTKEDEKKGTLTTQEKEQTVTFEAGTLPLRFVLSAQQAERSIETTTEDGQTEVSVQGALSENMTVEAETVEKADDIVDNIAQNTVQKVADTAADSAIGNNTENTVADAVDGELVGAWDISLSHKEEGVCQPDAPVTVTITDDAIGNAMEEGVDLTVWSVSEEGEAVQVEGAEFHDNTVEFETESLATFAVTYTVDFHWGDYTYNLDGGSTLLLSELLSILAGNGQTGVTSGIEETGLSGEDSTYNPSNESAEVYSTEQLVEIVQNMDLVENVTFSDPSLIQVDEVWLASYDINYEEANVDSEEEDDEALVDDGNAVKDWRLVSLEPFDTDETLTIYLKNGEVITIPVTDARVREGEASTGGRVTVDGVTYTLVSGTGNGTSTKSNEGDGKSYDGRATVYAISKNCTIHNEIEYGGKLYKVWDLASNLNRVALVNTGAKLDAKLVNRAADYYFRLPDMKTDVSEADKELWDSQGFVAGENNDGENTSGYKFWKKATYNPNTNSIDYEMKYFQSMKENVSLDFIFIYDDSITMYTGDRGAPTNNGNNNYNETVIREAQGTRIMILSAAQALLEKKDGYQIRMAMGGASSGDSRKSGWYEQSDAGYDGVETYLASYATGATNHNTGLNNALTLAKEAKSKGHQPIVIYLSDFKDGAYSATTANQLHNLARTYALVTDNNDSRVRARTIATSQSTIYTMSEIDQGVKQLETIILDAIGYYMKDQITVTDNLSDAMSKLGAGAGTTDTGSAPAATGKSVWTLGGKSPYPGAGVVHTDKFSVKLDDNTVYAGAMPTNGNATVTVNGKVVNTITPKENDPSVDPEDLHIAKSVDFILGRLDEKAKVVADENGVPTHKINNIIFTLTEAEKKAGETIYTAKSGAVSYSDKTKTVDGLDGVLSIPFMVGEGSNKTIVLEKGKSYILQEDNDSVDTYNNSASTKLVKPDKNWLITVDEKGIVTVSVNGVAGQTPDTTIAKPGRIALWNQQVVPATLIPITVQKTWPKDDSLRRDPAPFTIYGVNRTTGERTELIAYSQPDTSSTQVKYLDPNVCTKKDNVWTQTVYVPDKVDDTTKFYDYTGVLDISSLADGQKFKIGEKELSKEEWTKYATNGKVYYGGTYSYDIEEGDLVYPYGWYTPSYKNNASDKDNKLNETTERAAIDSYTGGEEEGEKEEWLNVDTEYLRSGKKIVDTSTNFTLSLDVYDYTFVDTDKRDEFKTTLGMSNYKIDTNAEKKMFFTRLKKLSFVIEKNGTFYRVTVPTWGVNTAKNDLSWNTSADSNYAHGVAFFRGIELPSEWSSLGGTRGFIPYSTLPIREINVTLADASGGLHDFTLYSTGPGPDITKKATSLNNSVWGPNGRSSYYIYSTAIYTGLSDYTNHIKTNVGLSQTLEIYAKKPGTNDEKDQTYSVRNPAVLKISNTWNPNTLVNIDVVKNWANADGDSGDEKQAISFSIDGVLPDGNSHSVPIFTNSDAAWSEGRYTETLSDSNKDEERSTDNMWVKTFYVPTYDTSTYNRENTPVCEAYTYTREDPSPEEIDVIKNSFTEAPLIVDTDVDGEPKGEWESDVEYETGNSETSGGGSTENWTDITLTNNLNHFYIHPKTTIPDVTAFVIQLEYNYSTTETREYWFYLVLPQKLTLYPRPKDGTNGGKDNWGSGSNLTNTNPYNFEFNGFSELLSGKIKSIEQLYVFTGDLEHYYDLTGSYTLKTSGVKNASEGELGFSSGGKALSGNNNYSIPDNNVAIRWRSTTEIPEETTTTPATFTLTNTYTPYRAVTLKSTFTDGSDDKTSTDKIESVTYIFKNEDGEVVRTTTAALTSSNGTRTAEKTIYVKPDTYTVSQRYNIGSDSYTLDGSLDAYDVKVNGTLKDDAAYTDPNNNSTARTITFDNTRKTLPVQVKLDWEPGLQNSEDPLSGHELAYSISYESADLTPTPVSGDFKLTSATQVNDHNLGNIPTYSVRETLTECKLSDVDTALPDYELNVVPSEENINSVKTMVFTIEAHIKRASVIIEKFWEGIDDNNKNGTILTYTLTRSDGQKIYGTDKESVELIINVPASDVPTTMRGEFVLQDENTTEADRNKLGLDTKTAKVYALGENIYLPVIRESEVTAGVKYVISEAVKKDDTPLSSYFPNFSDQTNNAATLFEQTNPAGKNIDSEFGKANMAKFCLVPDGIIIGVGNMGSPYICKIVDEAGEHPFRYLRDALTYARGNLDGKAVIEMLVDYVIPSGDTVVLDQPNDNITITTAKTSGGVYNFVDTLAGKADADKGTAVLTKNHNNDMFTIKKAGAKLYTADIIFDGDREGTLTKSKRTGRAIQVDQGSVEILGGSEFRHFKKDEDGGAVNAENSTDITLTASDDKDIIFTDCTSKYGGAMCTDSGKVTITNSGAGKIEFNQCTTSSHHGGAIFSGSVEMTNSGTVAFTDCKATSDGGGIRTKNGITINNSGNLTFTNCDADCGGAMENNDSGEISIVNTGTVTIMGSDTGKDYHGGGISNYKGAVNIENDGTISIADCTTGAGGAGIYAKTTFTLTGSGSTSFSKCTATKDGGGIRADGDVEITTTGNISFNECTSSSNGGGIYAGEAVTISGEASFTNCTASSNGGAIYATGAANLTNTSYTDCEAKNGNGGAVCSGGALTLTGTAGHYAVFEDCHANATSDNTGGGAIYHNSGNLKLEYVFFGKRDTDGKAIPGNVSAQIDGGAVYTNTSGKVQILHCEFLGCKTTKATDKSNQGLGGAVFFSDNTTNIYVENSNFEYCEAERYGGALCYENNNTVGLNVKDCTFNHCYANHKGGGAIHSDFGLNVSDCTFDNCFTNGKGGAINTYYAGEVSLTNVDINGHTDGGLDTTTANASLGGAVYSGGNLTIKQRGTGTSEIKNCSASEANGGAINMASDKCVTFEGNVVIHDNYGTESLAGQQKNVVLEKDNNTVIKTSDTGLGANAHIGVYVIESQFEKHGDAGKPFGTRGTSVANFDCFENDVNGLLGTQGEDKLIIWASSAWLQIQNKAEGTYVFHVKVNNGDYKKTIYEKDSKTPINIVSGQDYYELELAISGSAKSNSKVLYLPNAGGMDYTVQVFKNSNGSLVPAAFDAENLSWNVTESDGEVKTDNINSGTLTSGPAPRSTEPGNDGGLKATFNSLNYDESDSSKREYTRVTLVVAGQQIAFMKIDSSGAPINGAEFRLYSDLACTKAVDKIVSAKSAKQSAEVYDGSNWSSKKDHDGIVRFDKVSPGIYYMKETTVPNGYTNDSVYAVIVGKDYMDLTKLQAAKESVFADVTQDALDAQNHSQKTESNGDYGDKTYAIFKIVDGKADINTDIVNYGLVNSSSTQKKVILRKVSDSYAPLPGAKFEIYNSDMTLRETTEVSENSGVFWIRTLPLGTYYLKEVQTPDGYASNKDKFFTLNVTADGVTVAEVSGTPARTKHVVKTDVTGSGGNTPPVTPSTGDYDVVISPQKGEYKIDDVIHIAIKVGDYYLSTESRPDALEITATGGNIQFNNSPDGIKFLTNGTITITAKIKYTIWDNGVQVVKDEDVGKSVTFTVKVTDQDEGGGEGDHVVIHKSNETGTTSVTYSVEAFYNNAYAGPHQYTVTVSPSDGVTIGGQAWVSVGGTEGRNMIPITFTKNGTYTITMDGISTNGTPDLHLSRDLTISTLSQ